MIKRMAKQTTNDALEIEEISGAIIEALDADAALPELLKTAREILDPSQKYSHERLIVLTEYISEIALKISLARRQAVLTA